MTDRNSNVRLYKIYLLFAYALSFISSVSMTAIFYKFFEEEANNYSLSAPSYIGYLPYGIFILGIIVFSSSLFVIKKDAFSKSALPKNYLITKAVSAIVFVSMLSIPVLHKIRGYSNDKLSFTSLESYKSVKFFITLSVIFAILGSIYFIVDIFSDKKLLISGICLLIFLSSYTLRLYFDMTMHLNNPRRMLSITAICASLLFILAEMRFYNIKPSGRWYMITGMTAVMILSTDGISNILLNITGFFDDGIQLSYYIFELAFALYISLKLALFLNKDNFTLDELSEKNDAKAKKSEEKKNESVKKIPGCPDDISYDEYLKMYDYVYSSVAKRMNDSDKSKDTKEEIKSKTLEILCGVFENNSERGDRIENLRRAVNGEEPEEE